MHTTTRHKHKAVTLPIFATLMLSVFLAPHLAAAEPAEFPTVTNSPNFTETPISASEALQSIQLPDGFQVTLFAAEPDLRQPIAMTTDERGRLWVAENYTYSELAVNFSQHFRDRIVILEDTDGDGRFDHRKIFWDQGRKLTSVAIGFGGVWVLCAPQLLFIPDSDRDDIPDGDPIVILDGWNDGVIRHNIVNGLRWGPDGWLYGRHGIDAMSQVGKPGSPPSARVKLSCSIWRYHPVRKVFEVVAEGTTNPWGLDYDEHGQLFFVNTVIGHLWHLVPGAHYRRMYGADQNAHVYKLMAQCADHFHWGKGETLYNVSDPSPEASGGHVHSGLMIYLGDNFPDRYRNKIFTVNLVGRRVNTDWIERRGSGYVGRHGKNFLISGDPWFRGLELLYGPDGGVFLADWSDTGDCHDNDGVHRKSGRIYKVTYGKPSPALASDLFACTDLELVNYQYHKNDWYARISRRLLQERASQGILSSDTRDTLFHAYEQQANIPHKLRLLWCLYGTGSLDDQWLQTQLRHPNEHIRVWAIRLLADSKDVSPSVLSQLVQMADDPSGLVRLFLASTLQRIPLEQRWELASRLVAQGKNSNDDSLELMIWYGIEPAVPAHPGPAVALAEQSSLELIRRHIARRLAADIDANPQAVDDLLKVVIRTDQSKVQRDILLGINEALRGRRKAPTPASWSQVAPTITKNSEPSAHRAARELRVVFGEGRALKELVQMVVRQDTDPENRRDALRTLVQYRAKDLGPFLQKFIGHNLLSAIAIRGLAASNLPATPKLILDHYPQLDDQAREAAIGTLASRRTYAAILLQAIRRGWVGSRDVSAYHARQMRSFHDPHINQQLNELWGSVRQTSEEKRQQITRLKRTLTVDRLRQADLSAGRQLFDKVCARCHTLYGRGHNIGPDLTGSNRNNLDYLLENIVDPSATMIKDYKMSLIALNDGRILTGVVLEKNEHTLTLQTQQEQLILSRQDIESLVLQDVSLMPEGLLNSLKSDEIRDLVAYLAGRSQASSPQQVQPAPEP